MLHRSYGTSTTTTGPQGLQHTSQSRFYFISNYLHPQSPRTQVNGRSPGAPLASCLRFTVAGLPHIVFLVLWLIQSGTDHRHRAAQADSFGVQQPERPDLRHLRVRVHEAIRLQLRGEVAQSSETEISIAPKPQR